MLFFYFKWGYFNVLLSAIVFSVIFFSLGQFNTSVIKEYGMGLSGVIESKKFSFFSDLFSFSVVTEAVSFLLILLTILIFCLAFLISLKHVQYGLNFYCGLLFFLQLLLILIFCVTNLGSFYIIFEFVLLPVFLLIGMWGSRDRKVYASLQFFLMTVFFSLFFFFVFLFFRFYFNYNFLILSFESNYVPISFQLYLWYFMLMSFLVKLPVFPLHFWLPEAHGEASTAGSMILAGILLKLGSYGILKFLLDFSDISDIFYVYYLYFLILVSATFSTFVILFQTDFKKLIAYSSVSHMAIVTLGLFSCTYDGIDGAIFLMISHGLVSSALFMSVGLLYDRHKTRMLRHFAGLIYFMPSFSFFFMVFLFSNMGLPGTSGFIGEFLIFNNMLFSSLIIILLLFIAFFLTGCYTVWHLNRLLYTPQASVTLYSYCDLTFREYFVCALFTFFIFFLGLYPTFFFNFLG